MEHEVIADPGGEVTRVDVAVGDTVSAGQSLALVKGSDPLTTVSVAAPAPVALDEVLARHAAGLDAARPEAVARRREQGRRTARENVADLVDAGTFVEYGPLIFAAQERRRPKEELIARTPADGLVGGDRRHRRVARRGHVLRLHGPGRHAGHAQPSQEGPAVRARRAAAAAGRAVRRGRGRAAGRRRLADRGRARLPRVPLVRAAVRAGAARRDRGGLLLRRQRGAARLLRRRDRHRGLEHRHGRAGDDRGRRARRARAGGRRPDRRAGRERRRRPARGRRGGGGRRRQALPVVLRPGAASRSIRRRRCAG